MKKGMLVGLVVGFLFGASLFSAYATPEFQLKDWSGNKVNVRIVGESLQGMWLRSATNQGIMVEADGGDRIAQYIPIGCVIAVQKLK